RIRQAHKRSRSAHRRRPCALTCAWVHRPSDPRHPELCGVLCERESTDVDARRAGGPTQTPLVVHAKPDPPGAITNSEPRRIASIDDRAFVWQMAGEMGNILGSLPVGEKIGIAFSGGLDTSAALYW